VTVVQRLSLTLFATALVLAPTPARAQVRGVVVDADGRALPGVLVELWDSQRRLAGDGSDPTGHFRLAGASDAVGPRVVLARGIGLEPVRRLLASSDSVVRLVMQSHAILIEAANVEAEPSKCPPLDDPRARALWQQAASHYDIALSAYGVRTDVMLFAALVAPDSLGVIDTTRLVATFIHGGYSALAFATRFNSDKNFYGVPAAGVPWRRYGRWHYPLLESSGAWHFADAMFAAANRLALVASGDEGAIIAFCSSLGTRPYIQGQLTIAPDTTLASAEWEYVTPQPREDAGGQVLFAPADPARRGQPLVPVAGLFWRRVLRQVYQEWMEYRKWMRCEGPLSCDAPAPLRPDSAPPPGAPPPP
jgi:hypothetical protein